MRQFSMSNILSPDGLLAPAADAAGRTSSYKKLSGSSRAFIVYHLNQGNAATVTLTPLQAKDTAGTGSKAITTAKIYANEDCSQGSGNLVQQADGVSYTTGATTKEKLVIFELDLSDAFDLNNGFVSIAAQTSASNAANITSAEIYMYGPYEGTSGLGID